MSGHSHAKTIKHQKELTDKKRGQMFSKMSRLISVTVKEGMLAWKISKQFVMQGERYRMIYDAEKLRLTAERIGEDGELYCPHLAECQAKLKKRAKPACKGHIDAMAKRKAVKLFLSHLWEKWRELEGLPIRQPYVIERMGHTTKQEPEDK